MWKRLKQRINRWRQRRRPADQPVEAPAWPLLEELAVELFDDMTTEPAFRWGWES